MANIIGQHDIDPGHAIDELRGISTPEGDEQRQALGDINPTDETKATPEEEAAKAAAAATADGSNTDGAAQNGNDNSSRQQSDASAGGGKGVFDNLQSEVAEKALTQEELANVIAYDPNRLIEIPGQGTVPMHRAIASMQLKATHDKAMEQVAAERQEIAKDKAVVQQVLPVIDKLFTDEWGKAYADNLFTTNDPEKARRAADAIMGWDRSAQAGQAPVQQVDPRTVPPRDENGDVLAEDDPEYLKWKAGPNLEYRLEQQKRETIEAIRGELGADKAKEVERQKAEAAKQDAMSREEQQIFEHNTGIVKSLPQVILERKGIDVNTLTQTQRHTVFSQIDEMAKSFGKQLANDSYLKQNVLVQSDIIAAVLAAPFTRESLMAGIEKLPEVKNTGNGADTTSQSQAAQPAETKKPLSAGPESRGSAPAALDYDKMDPNDVLDSALTELRSDNRV